MSVALVVASAHALHAQRPRTPPYTEYRVDAIDGKGTAVQTGAAYTIPMGVYVRLAALGGIGPRWVDGESTMSGRTDIIARFLLDPFEQTRLALSLGGGVSVPYEEGRVTRPFLTAVIDVEGRQRGRLTPAVQIGLGGGLRVGFALRTSVRQRR
jgi:hypothetical protein